MGTIRNQRRLLAEASLLLMLGVASCDGPTGLRSGPRSGSIKVSVKTSGGVPNNDQLQLVVGSTHRLLSTQSTIVINDISAGTYTVALEGLAGNCTVSGSPSVSTDVPAGATVEVEFAILCATTGFQLTTRTTGYDNPFSYGVMVNGQSVVNGHVLADIGPNDSVVVSGVEPGTYTITLGMPGVHCTVPGQPITVQVSNRAVTPVQVEITCVRPIRPEKIAYVSDDPHGLRASSISLMNPDGSGATALIAGHSPAWSPDATRLVFSTMQCDDDYYYYYNDVCTGGLLLLDTELQRLLPLNAGGNATSPSWAPSGDVIAFVDDKSRLFLIKLDGSPAVELPVRGTLQVKDPAWSPDGQRIAFECMVESGNDDICTVNRDGTGLVRLTTDGTIESHPAWSPDGTRIAFTSTPLPSVPPEIWLIAAKGGALTKLTDGFDPAWSRDGTKVVFARNDGLFTIDVDGSNLKRLTTGLDYAPAWRP